MEKSEAVYLIHGRHPGVGYTELNLESVCPCRTVDDSYIVSDESHDLPSRKCLSRAESVCLCRALPPDQAKCVSFQIPGWMVSRSSVLPVHAVEAKRIVKTQPASCVVIEYHLPVTTFVVLPVAQTFNPGAAQFSS